MRMPCPGSPDLDLDVPGTDHGCPVDEQWLEGGVIDEPFKVPQVRHGGRHGSVQ